MITFPYEMHSKQQDAIDLIKSPRFRGELFVAPTGLGKTAVGEVGIDEFIMQGMRTIWISPQKALTSQQKDDFSGMFGDASVALITGDHSDADLNDPDACAEYQIFLFTYEKLESVLHSKKNQSLFFDDLSVGLIVVDEAHMIADKERGAKLEAALMATRALFPNVRFIYLSATVGEPEKYAAWAGVDLVVASIEERPVPLKIQIQSYPAMYKPAEKFAYRLGMLKNIIGQYPDSKILVFCTSQERTRQIARIFAGLDDEFDSDDDLAMALLDRGATFHNASLTHDVRKEIELSFKDDPSVKLVACTSTLSYGVNFPADICVMFDTTLWEYKISEEHLLEDYDYHQIMGRAGRRITNPDGTANSSNFGLAVLFSEEKYEKAINDIITKPLILKSRMGDALNREALSFFVYYVNSKEQLSGVLSKAYNPIPKEKSDVTFEWLVENNFIRAGIDGFIEPTFRGKMTTYSMIKPETALKIIAVNEEAKDKKFRSPDEFMWLFDNLLHNDEFLDQIVVRQSNKNDQNALFVADEVYDFCDQRIAKAFVFLFKKYLAVTGVITHAEAKSINGDSELYNFQKAAQMFTRAAQKLCPQNQTIYRVLEKMVTTGMLDPESCKLAMVKGIGNVSLERLFRSEITSVEKFLATETAKLAKILKFKEEHVEKMKVLAKTIYHSQLF